MKKKTLLFSFIIAILCICLIGCGTETNSNNNTIVTNNTKKQEEILLNSYYIELFVGETYKLESSNAQGTIKYDIERDYVVNCQDGVINALSVGNTFVNVIAENGSSSCYVLVKSGERGEVFTIKAVEANLYKAIPSKLGLFVSKDGGDEVEISGVTWSVDNGSITQDGKILVSSGDSVVVTASFLYKGEQKTISSTMAVDIYGIYSLSVGNELKLASPETYSGKVNNRFTKSVFNLSIEDLSGDVIIIKDFTLSIPEEEKSVFSAEKREDGKIVVEAKKYGQGTLSVVYKNSKNIEKTLKVNVNVYNAISTIEDLDKLASATYSNVEDYKSNYILTNDIDYNGQCIYPIASYWENCKLVGYRWQSIIEKNEDSYSFTRTGSGLTESEFINFALNKGANPKETWFSGTIDGNGFAIKNAKLLYGTFIVEDTLSSLGITAYSSVYSCFIGKLSGSIVNLELDILQETPVANTNKYYDLTSNQLISFDTYTRVYWDDTTNGDKMSNQGEYKIRFHSPILRASGAVFKNNKVTITLDTTRPFNSQLSGYIYWADNIKFTNNILCYNRLKTKYSWYVSFVGASPSASGDIGKLTNNLSMGCQYLYKYNTSNITQNGTGGNYYITNTEVSNLLSLQSINQTIETFDNSIWDLSKFNNNDKQMPTLINGCSVYSE